MQSGHIVRWCVLLTDIDERKRAEDALRESERESRLIVDSIPGLIAAFTPGGEVEFVNRQVLEYFGRTLEELKRWGTGGSTHPEDLPRVVERFSDSIASGEPFEFEVRAQRFDGVYRWFQSRGFPLRDANGTSSAGTTCSSTSTSASAPRRPSRRASAISSSSSTRFRRWRGRRGPMEAPSSSTSTIWTSSAFRRNRRAVGAGRLPSTLRT